MPTLNLDTHILVHALQGSLDDAERELLSENDWGVAAIVLWELAKLKQLGRIDVDLTDPEVDSALARVHVWPLDLAVARASTQLDFRGAPADEMIAATSIVHRVPLVTRDRQIRASKVVPLAT
jgi:PIN domain nuclease of toxin-antitoxin system